MSAAYRVRYVLTQTAFPRPPDHSRTIELGGSLHQVPGQLPAGAYILSIEDLAAGRDVHWTRWPEAFRPGYGEKAPAPAR